MSISSIAGLISSRRQQADVLLAESDLGLVSVVILPVLVLIYKCQLSLRRASEGISLRAISRHEVSRSRNFLGCKEIQ